MKQFVKICLVTGGCSLILGMLLLGIGVFMGARPGQYARAFYFDHWTDLFDFDNTVKPLDEIEDILDEDVEAWTGSREGSRDKGEYGYAPRHEGGISSTSGNFEYDESFTEEIRDVEIEVGDGAIQLIPYEGNAVRVQADNIKKYFQCWVEGEEFHIEDRRKNADEELNLMVYLPEKGYGELKIELGAGQFEAQELKAEEIEIQMGAGECEIQRIEAGKEAKLQVGAGRIWLGAFSGKKLSGECAAGEMDIWLEGGYEDYNYDIACAAGEILLDGESRTGLVYREKIDNKADKKVELNCAIGTVQINFLDEQ